MSICNILCVVLAMVLKLLANVKNHSKKMIFGLFEFTKHLSLTVFYTIGFMVFMILGFILIPMVAIVEILRFSLMKTFVGIHFIITKLIYATFVTVFFLLTIEYYYAYLYDWISKALNNIVYKYLFSFFWVHIFYRTTTSVLSKVLFVIDTVFDEIRKAIFFTVFLLLLTVTFFASLYDWIIIVLNDIVSKYFSIFLVHIAYRTTTLVLSKVLLVIYTVLDEVKKAVFFTVCVLLLVDNFFAYLNDLIIKALKTMITQCVALILHICLFAFRSTISVLSKVLVVLRFVIEELVSAFLFTVFFLFLLDSFFTYLNNLIFKTMKIIIIQCIRFILLTCLLALRTTLLVLFTVLYCLLYVLICFCYYMLVLPCMTLISLCSTFSKWICFHSLRFSTFILETVKYYVQCVLSNMVFVFFYYYYYNALRVKIKNTTTDYSSLSLEGVQSSIPIDRYELGSFDSGGSTTNSDSDQKDLLKRMSLLSPDGLKEFETQFTKKTIPPIEKNPDPLKDYHYEHSKAQSTPEVITANDSMFETTSVLDEISLSSNSILLFRSQQNINNWIVSNDENVLLQTPTCGYSFNKIAYSSYSHPSDHIHSVFHPIYEFIRQGIPENDFIFVNQVNDDDEFTVCPSYPATFVVPNVSKNISRIIKLSTEWRKKKRLPALTYYHKETNACIYRCSQPLLTLTKEPGDNDYMSNLGTTEKKLKIVDCRSGFSASENMVQMGGYESSSDIYDVNFYNIENIYSVRDAFENDKKEETRERQYRSIIRAAKDVVLHIKAGHNVLIHCSDGWNRTAQVCALSKFLLDPYYHTKRGFQCLFEMDFMAFGHQLASRSLNNPIQDIGETGPIITQLLVCILKIIQDEKLNLPWFKKVSSCILSIIYNDPCVYSFIDRSPFKSRKIYQEYARAFMRNNSFVLLDRDAQRWKMKKDLAFSKRLQNEMNYLFDPSFTPEVRI